MNSSSDKQISMIEYFSKDREAMPSWLENFEIGQKVRVGDIFRSRIVYNPGAGFEGAPIRTFNASHAAHTFVYVDYGFNKETVDSELSDGAFHGYHLIHAQNVARDELFSGAPVYHLDNEDIKIIKEGYARMNVDTDNSFGILKIFQRNADLGDDHGALRFAVLYLGADAIAAYDVLFGNTDCTPFASVIDTYGFGGAYEPFTKGSVMERIAQRTNCFPQYLLCRSDVDAWEGYSMLKTVGGSYGRFLRIKE